MYDTSDILSETGSAGQHGRRKWLTNHTTRVSPFTLPNICHLWCDLLIREFGHQFDAKMSKRSLEGHQNSPLLKRNRKTLSCNNCRRQKLKCDRETPVCSRCGSTGNADSCTYGRPETDLLQYSNGRNDEVNPESLVRCISTRHSLSRSCWLILPSVQRKNHRPS
jgi:hypothetical protein